MSVPGSSKGILESAYLAILLCWSAVFCLPCFSAETDTPSLRPGITPEGLKRSYTLSQAVEAAVKSYPSIRRTSMSSLQARHEITVAKTQYLPRIDALYQQMQATQNVIQGTILPQFLNVIPIQSGQPHNSSTFSSIFGTNAGLNFSWELIDFGKRAANVNVARRALSSRQAAERLTELDVATRAADLYLKFVMTQQQILVCKATLDRMQDWALVVHTLCDKGLKPGVDAARADAEVSMAKIELVDAIRDSELAEQDLTEAMGRAGMAVDTVSAPLLDKRFTSQSEGGPFPQSSHHPPFTADSELLPRHPLAILKMADVDVARSRLQLLNRTWYPHLWYESAIWGRGSGDRQVIRPVAGGILPSTGNWAVGFTLQFPFMDYFKVKAQKNVERAAIEVEKANYDLAMQQLIREDVKAKILLNRAREVAAETPVLVKAARENETMARERYRVGLTNVIEVAQAERILAKAEVADAVAQLKVWQAMLTTAYTHGDLRPFLALAKTAETSK